MILSKIRVTVFIQNQNILGLTKSKENKLIIVWKRNVIILMENCWTSKMGYLYKWLVVVYLFFLNGAVWLCSRKWWAAKGIPEYNLQQVNYLCLMTPSCLRRDALETAWLSSVYARSLISGQFQTQWFSFKVSKVGAYITFYKIGCGMIWVLKVWSLNQQHQQHPLGTC